MTRFKRLILAALRGQLAGERTLPPLGAAPLWAAFHRLSRARTWHAHGPNPISFQEVEAYCRLFRVPFEPGHIDIITAMDEAWLAHSFEAMRSKTSERKTIPPASKRPLSAALFDAIF